MKAKALMTLGSPVSLRGPGSLSGFEVRPLQEPNTLRPTLLALLIRRQIGVR